MLVERLIKANMLRGIGLICLPQALPQAQAGQPHRGSREAYSLRVGNDLTVCLYSY